ncbi:Tyrosinase [Dactylellina cionopaga]|nr:Tyrosinase [Dactylellina cionopaga]
MTRSSALLQTLVYALSLNAAIEPVAAAPLDTEADWAFAANNLVKRDPAPPSPLFKGQVAGCTSWKLVKKTDTCDTIATKYKSTVGSVANMVTYELPLPSSKLNIVFVETSREWIPSDYSKKTYFMGVANNLPGMNNIDPKILSRLNPPLSSEDDCDDELANAVNKYICLKAKATKSTTTSKAASKTTAKAGAKSTTTTAKGGKATAKGDDEGDGEDKDKDAEGGGDDEEETPTAPSGPKGTFVVGSGDGQCAERQNINVMEEKQPDVFNLLLLALSALQKAPQSDPFSYYGLSSIHGAPYKAWPDDKAKPANNNPNLGYCTHRSILFATWHRPYMLAFEQSLYNTGKDIASKFTGASKTKYAAAAKLLRWPYWDWADDKNGQSHLPPVAMKDKVTVMQPDKSGKAVSAEIDNPFYAYRFKKDASENAFLKAPFVNLPQTNRRPKTANGASDDAKADTTMMSSYATRRKQAYNMLMIEDGFNEFSNALENIHNDVHSQVGGNGIMSYISYAAFDPIFWLHHNNIDRMLAIWQAANPGVYLTPDWAVATYQRIVANEDEDEDNLDTELYPWKHPDGKYWTSQDVKDVSSIWKYGYGYPEVPCSYKGKSATDLDEFATSAINDLYGGSGGATKIKGRAASEDNTEWDVSILVDQAEVPGTFAVYAFLGQPPSDPTKWDDSPIKISTLTLLGTPGIKKASKVQAATMPLGPLLKAKGVTGSAKEVEDYLNKNLIWTCLNMDTSGTAKLVDVKKMKTLKVAVSSSSVVLPTDKKKKPQFGAAVLSAKATKDKTNIGGATDVAQLSKPRRLDGKQMPIRPGTLKLVDPKAGAKPGAPAAKPAASGSKPAAKPATKPAEKKKPAK